MRIALLVLSKPHERKPWPAARVSHLLHPSGDALLLGPEVEPAAVLESSPVRLSDQRHTRQLVGDRSHCLRCIIKAVIAPPDSVCHARFLGLPS